LFPELDGTAEMIITMLLAAALALGMYLVSWGWFGDWHDYDRGSAHCSLRCSAKPKERGKVVGMVMSGLLIGILLLGRLADLWEQV